MSHEDKNISGSLILDLKKCWRHVQAKNKSTSILSRMALSDWLRNSQIICTEQISIYISTFPNALTSKKVINHEISTYIFL